MNGVDTARYGTVTSKSPTLVSVTGNHAPNAVWDGLVDATSHCATRVAPRELEMAATDAQLWLWWFVTEAAGSWTWDPTLVHQLKATGQEGADLDAAIGLGSVRQSQWPSGIDLGSLGLLRTLTVPQERDIARMIRLGGGANFSVPGAGKTTMAYVAWAVFKARKEVKRCLVVAPLSAHEAWQTEPDAIFEASARPAVVVRPDIPFGEVAVVNYELLESPERLESLRAWVSSTPTLVIFDEAHRVKKGRLGVRGRGAIALSRAAARRIVLTGTPRPNSQDDLDAVMELAYPGRGTGFARSSPDRLASTYCRITKAELGLPPLVTSTERIPMSPAHDRVYEAMVDVAARAVVDDPAILNDLTRAGRIAMLLMQAATDPTAALDVDGHLRMTEDKPEQLLEELILALPASVVPTKFVRTAQIVADHSKNGTKVVVWVCFRRHLDRLARLLSPHQPAVVHGGVVPLDPAADTDRAREIERFRDDPACTVLLATPHTLSEGISLHHTTTHQLHVDRTYNAGMLLQSLDRTHRLGLPGDANCTATYLVAERSDGSGCIDATIAARLDTKINAMGAALDDPGLNGLALPGQDDLLSPMQLAIGDGGTEILRELFAHLARQI